jgi:hypothetical protein
MTALRTITAACAAGLLLTACGGEAKGPSDTTGPQVSFQVHVIRPDGTPAGEHVAGKATAPIAIDAIDRLELIAQGMDAESGTRSLKVDATIDVACDMPDKSVKATPQVQKTAARMERPTPVPTIMATSSGPATELFGLKCDPPAISGKATIKLVAEAENNAGVKGNSATIELVASMHP